MFKKPYLGMAVAAAIAMPGVSVAELETSVILKNETAVFVRDGMRTGEATSTIDNDGEGREIYKFENSARIFVNGDIGEESSWHGELNVIYDAAAESGYKGHENYSQHDWLRELYMDTNAAGWDIRLGKQQVVWGTADGIKLLDIINPTDYREFSQNAMEDSRIPIWMVNAERYLDNGGNIQFVLAQNEPNKIPGLGADSDSNHPFIMKGVDSISGEVNGFLNIAPALGLVARTFVDAADANFGVSSLAFFDAATVSNFADGGANAADGFDAACGGDTSAACLAGLAQATNNNVTNILDNDPAAPADSSWWDATNPDSAFEYMGNAAFSTFNTYANATTIYRKSHPDTLEPNLGFRFRNSTEGGTNYSLNYFYHYDANPVVNTHWENSAGERLTVTDVPNAGNTRIELRDSSGNPYGRYDVDNPGSLNPVERQAAVLVFEETLERIHSIGGSFDTTIDSFAAPIVLRGEVLYQAGVHVPVIDRTRLGIGDLSGGLKTEEADFFKYVIGADTTVMTNLFVSGQFIQFRNLDFVDGATRYTADPSTLHLTNGLQKGWENKNFYSLYLSKPFGESELGRWNNILIYEQGGGYWDRIDAEYSLSDEIVLTGEINMYWGDENTTFGQFKNSSNVQVGMKWIMQ